MECHHIILNNTICLSKYNKTKIHSSGGEIEDFC